MQKIQTAKEKFAIVDNENFEKVSKYKWFTGKNRKYVMGQVDGKLISLHHFLFGKPKGGMVVDHINGDPHDNRKENIRFCSQSQNRANSKKNCNNTSGFKGVSPRKNKWGEIRWKVEIKVREKHLYLGDYENKMEAAYVYNEAAQKYFGEFAKINII